MEQPLDYADRVHLMQRLNRSATAPMRSPKNDTFFTRMAIMCIGMIVGMTLITMLRACDPLPIPVPHYAMRLPQ